MKPSVARKLNEKIRGLEAELEELRSNKKVKELEKKVQVRADNRAGGGGSGGGDGESGGGDSGMCR